MLIVAATLLSLCSEPCGSVPVKLRFAQRTVDTRGRDTTPARAAARSTRPTRLCAIRHRPHREAAAPPVWFHFEPQMAAAALGPTASVHRGPPATVPGSSRAPPSTTLAA
jgi:hypothetical protein